MKKTKTLAEQTDKTSFGYNAVESIGRRQAPQIKVKNEHVILTEAKREKLQATAMEQWRNHALLAWMVRKHLAYVTRFEPHFRTGKTDLDRRVMALFTSHAKKENFDIAGRHDRNESMFLFEMMKVLGGDCLFQKLKTGHLQGIEPDRVTKPIDIPSSYDQTVNAQGLMLDDYSRVKEYCITNRGEFGNEHKYDHMAKATDIIFDGYFFRFDQYRGISPLTTAINGCQDLAEAWEWTLLKIKIHSLFGIAVMREGDPKSNYNKKGYGVAGTTNPTSDTSVIPNTISPTGIMSLDLNVNDKVDTVESRTPSNEMQSYSELMIRVVLLALDIPFTAFNSMASSFSARIADRVEYEEAARSKREKNGDVLRQYSDWMIDRWIAQPDALGKLAKQNGMTADDIKYEMEWIPAGTPWLDKTKEVDGDTRALAIGADSTPRICKRRGQDAFVLIDEQSEFLEYAKSKGVPIYTGAPGQNTANPPTETDDDLPVKKENKDE